MLKICPAEDKLGITETAWFICHRIQIIVRKRENSCNQHFLLSDNASGSIFPRVIKVEIVL